jgi:hypothetical protein
MKIHSTHWEGCWRVHHDCARALLKQLANGWLAYDKLRLLSTKAIMDKIAREIIGDDNVPRERVKDD